MAGKTRNWNRQLTAYWNKMSKAIKLQRNEVAYPTRKCL